MDTASVKNTLRIGLAQLNMRWEDKDLNKKRVERLVGRASELGVDLVIFPEMTLTGFSMNLNKTGENEEDSDTVNFFKKLSKKYKVALVFGAVFVKNRKGKNMLVMIDKDGQQVSSYQKIHPFSLGKENKYFIGGNKVGRVPFRGFKLAFLICYDLRFIGLAYLLLASRPDILICIANWPERRIKQWQALLRARALDLQCYVVGVNRRGKGGDLNYTGKSAVIFADGSYENTFWKGALGVVDVSKKKLELYRESFPFLKDNRPKVYGSV